MDLLLALKQLIVVFCIAVLVFLTYFGLQPNYNPTYLVQRERNISNAIKVILFWNGFFSYPSWGLSPSTRKFNCGDAECIFTNNHSFFASINQFDALIFHAAVPFDRPPVRDIKQHYVFALLESPLNTKHSLSEEQNFYNLTMTYRIDSDVLWAYSYVWDVETHAIVAPARFPHWRQPNFDFMPTENLRLQLKSKTKSIAWFVSNCNTFSKRERLVRELQNYMQVDIFGHCGDKQCLQDVDECDKMLDNEYKFYLSFENSLCTDYVTEKLFNILKRNVIPVVFGGSNYSRFAPPHSYIDAQDFRNVAELGSYLQYLGRNLTEYTKYFWWKDFYVINSYEKGVNPVYCNLCAHLNSESLNHRTQFYGNIEEYWLQACQSEAKIEF